MKLTDEQRELIALIPKAIRKSKEYTDATKLVLGQIDFMHGTDFAEVNGYIFCSNDKMSEETGVSVSQVKRVVKILVNEGLITTKRGFRNKEGKEASKYWLTDLYYELANRPKPKNEPLIGGQNEIEEKNEPLDIELEIEKELETDIKIHDNTISCTGEDNSKNQHRMKINERLITDDEKDAWDVLSVDDNFDYTQYEDISEMVQSDTGNKGVKNGLSVFDKRNNIATYYYDELESLVKVLFKCWDEKMVMQYAENFNSIMDKVDKYHEAGWFTSKQCSKFRAIINNFNSILEKKDEIFKNGSVKGKSNSSDDSINSMGGCAAPSIEKTDNNIEPQKTDMLTNEDIMRAYMTEKELAQYGVTPTVEEPIAPYGNNSIKEAQRKFAMALAANG